MLRSYDSPARGGLQYPHRWGCVANTAGLKLLKNQGSRAEVRRMLQRLQPDRRGCFFISRGGSCLFEAREMIYTSTECDKALKSFADKWASMVLDHIKMCDTADIRLLQKELKETKKPHR